MFLALGPGLFLMFLALGLFVLLALRVPRSHGSGEKNRTAALIASSVVMCLTSEDSVETSFVTEPFKLIARSMHVMFELTVTPIQVFCNS